MKRYRALLLIAVLSLIPIGAASADEIPSYSFAGPTFGLATAPDGSLLVADAGAGIIELRKGQGLLVAALPNVSDVAPIGRGAMWAITGGGPNDGDAWLYRVSRDEGAAPIADLGAYEETVNPVPPEINPNPFDVAALNGGKALVADAGGNDLLIVDMDGNIDWVATFPEEPVSTANVKKLLGCPTSNAPACGLPDQWPAQAVSTSIAIGPDGAYYVGELKGFPAPTDASRIWRIEPGSLHVRCGIDPGCTSVANGFTSIIDLNFGPDGTLYVTEFDEATWAAVEIFHAPTSGTVNACNIETWACTELATGLFMPTATATDRTGSLYATVSLVSGEATVVELK